uniref:imidazole glycerol-phosphate synthase n=1 Tax=Vibrio cholerae TaxID=666 RepID=D6NLX7_VIBCL|nr:imidazole glycerol phosphate synthase cyclase [Vibrio cholerae]
MLRSRIIPCLLIRDGGLVKTLKFKDAKYVGDPINAVKIFNEKEADELMVLDIDASRKGKEPDFNLIEKLAAECRMPLCYGGGVTGAQQASRIIDMGVEKVAVSSAAINNPRLLNEMAAAVGRQSVVAVLDVRKKKGFFSKGYEVCTHNATRIVEQDPLALAKSLQDAGAGEIVINFVDLDGTMNGYDIDYAELFKSSLSVPLTFLGGAGSLNHISQLIKKLGIIGAAAGSLFVFKGKYRAVLINYPTPEQKMQLCRDADNK